jgi:hypothetical protein
LREAIASVQEAVKPFSAFSRRKATHLINEVAKLADNLDQLAHEEEKYGNTSSDDDENTRSSTSSSPQDSLSNSELVDIESETENTSVSSSSLQPVVESQGSVAVEDEQHEPVHIPCLQCGIKVLYYCTREGCKYSTHSFAEWKRHEESQKHSQQERFMCLECPQSPPPVDVNGNPACEFCRAPIPTLGTNLRAHYLQCQSAQQSSTTYGRKDRLIAHLRSHPGVVNVSHIAAAGKYTVDSKWPRQCGFCGVIFKAWDERMSHIAAHFQDGLDMSSWKLPFPQPKDFPPGFKRQPKGGDDSDDDMDDNDSHPNRNRTGIHLGASSASSRQKKNPNEHRGRGASHQKGGSHKHQKSLGGQGHEAETNDQGQRQRTLRSDRGRNVTSGSGQAAASVALERYLNDVDEPILIRLGSEIYGPSKASPRQTVIAKGVNIGSHCANQERELAKTEKRGTPISREGQLSSTSQGPSRVQLQNCHTLTGADFSGYRPGGSNHTSTSGIPAQSLRGPVPAADIPMKYMPVTGRISRAKKGVPVQTCEICRPVKVALPICI